MLAPPPSGRHEELHEAVGRPLLTQELSTQFPFQGVHLKLDTKITEMEDAAVPQLQRLSRELLITQTQ